MLLRNEYTFEFSVHTILLRPSLQISVSVIHVIGRSIAAVEIQLYLSNTINTDWAENNVLRNTHLKMHLISYLIETNTGCFGGVIVIITCN